MCEWLTVCVPVIEPGPPSPPDSVTVEEVTDSTAQLSWSRGRDNSSPITNYFIQTRTPFTVGWQRVNTGRQCSPLNFQLILNMMQLRWIPTRKLSYEVSVVYSQCIVCSWMKTVMTGESSGSREHNVIVTAYLWSNLNRFNDIYSSVPKPNSFSSVS